MKRKKRWSAFVVSTVSLIVTVPPSFVATDSHKIVIEVAPFGGGQVTVGTESAQEPAWALQITP